MAQLVLDIYTHTHVVFLFLVYIHIQWYGEFLLHNYDYGKIHIHVHTCKLVHRGGTTS